ncbi:MULTISPECIES: hypothetical protein [Acidithiobacillus]|uniref:DUF3987 domain-containing protein n=2 Tax=Acidithiobacillus TaxID=119977 RepID=A0A179BID2_ACIFR|nr:MULTISPECIES: hypothetical protein [Acidithiobacillus]MEB8487282.1 hypothetical protein [Acidithiobacillus ferriphilus]MEB8490412.1 hypothetical protein [Acidithiobacillus ferriphilus]MEB8494680.1 hypothetical protein [Acidithiobacillus ferriphilus]MEB8515265.1 hypothetical protein [Acidithiobacillus ferriphilus]MEB8519971.1 hypothetical protein [Acidithiobacillus ferriphilus]
MSSWDDVAAETYQAEDATDQITPPPVPDTDAMLSGIIGEIARAGSDGKEVHPVAVAAACLSWLSAEIGPDICLPIGDTRHHVNLFTLHIGRSARGGKGESLGLVRRIRNTITFEREDNPCGQMHNGGLSSREGLAGAVHDGCRQGKEEVPAVDDKRLWIVEAEFSNVLAQGKREGNTLLPALRDVWDGGNIQPLTKGRGMWSTHPHIALHGNITPGELQARIEAREINGGTFNRILMVWAERTCMVALPEPTDTSVVAGFARRIEDAIRWARGSYPTTRDSRKASMTPAAAHLWESLYTELKRPHPAGDLVAAATERRAPICLRIALIHAILEKSLMITPDHIRVGHAWAQYGAATAAYVLAGMGGQARDTDRERKVLAFLDKQPGNEADRRTITASCFKNRVSGRDLDRVLAPLVEDGALHRREVDPKAGGRKRVIYALQCANIANIADNQQRRGFERVEQCANNANNETGDGQSSQSSRDVRTVEALINAHCSQSSQTSQPAIENCPQCDGAGCPLCWPDDELMDGEV